MSRTISKLPFFVILMGVCALAMFVPAIHAAALDLNSVARPFLYGAILCCTFTVLIALVTSNHVVRNEPRSQLITLVAAFAALPIMLALPMSEAMPQTSFFNAYFEMVSSVTTTGASIFETPRDVPPPIHLWRALVSWLGGFLMLLTAIAILAPMNLAGFEVLRPVRPSEVLGHTVQRASAADRLARFALKLAPPYIGATGLLWLGLVVSGLHPFDGLCLALSTLSTSGIVPQSVLADTQIGFAGEFFILIFLMLAVSRQSFGNDANREGISRLLEDREMRLAVIVVTVLTLTLLLVHWLRAAEIGEQSNILAAIQAFWGSFFTHLSFLTTTGFTSSSWGVSQDWTGLPTPSLILAGLCILGGGVATTAGGVKLLRVYVLYRHGLREMARLVHPSSIGRAGRLGREVRREGAFVAWIFFMLFAMSIAAITIALGFFGLAFEEAFIFAISALSTTGPLVDLALDGTAGYADLGMGAKSVLLGAMIMGRLETLAIIALFNPEFWRG